MCQDRWHLNALRILQYYLYIYPKLDVMLFPQVVNAVISLRDVWSAESKRIPLVIGIVALTN